MNPKIGTINRDGTTTYPAETLAGAPFERGEYDPHPPIVHYLGADGHFCIGDVWPPRGFNVEEALQKLKAEVMGSGKADDTPAIGFEAGE